MLVYIRNVRVLQEIGVAESISSDIFATGSRINVLTAHAQILSSRKSPKMVPRSRNDRVYIERRMRWIQISNECDVRYKTGSSNMVETAHAHWKIAI